MLETLSLAEEAGFPAGSDQRRHGRGRGGRGARRPPGRREDLVHRQRDDRQADRGAAGGRLAPVTLELGGKSPNVVFADAALDVAEAGFSPGSIGAAGQSCVAGSRALLQRPIYDELLERVGRRTSSIALGDPMDAATEMGPIANVPQLRRIESMVAAARDEGANVVTGGERASVSAFPDGLFYGPTILDGVGNDAAIAQNEVFGPVLTVLPFESEDDAVAIANDTRFGLAAGVWTRDEARTASRGG